MKHSDINLDFERALWAKGIDHVAGVDEAGRGPLAGPVVAAAIIFPKELSFAGVDDSKKLSASKREKLYTLIYEKALGVGIGMVEHEIIDRLNILQAAILAMRKALEALSLIPEYVLVDGIRLSMKRSGSGILSMVMQNRLPLQQRPLLPK